MSLLDSESVKETEMPKMKTKSGAKKRFKVTATGRHPRQPRPASGTG